MRVALRRDGYAPSRSNPRPPPGRSCPLAAPFKSTGHDATHRPCTEMASEAPKKCYSFEPRAGLIARFGKARRFTPSPSQVELGRLAHYRWRNRVNLISRGERVG